MSFNIFYLFKGNLTAGGSLTDAIPSCHVELSKMKHKKITESIQRKQKRLPHNSVIKSTLRQKTAIPSLLFYCDKHKNCH